MIVPIRAILEAEHDPLFGPAEIAALTAAFDAALRKLELVDRHDPAAIAVAKLIVIAARKGERDPSRLCNGMEKTHARKSKKYQTRRLRR